MKLNLLYRISITALCCISAFVYLPTVHGANGKSSTKYVQEAWRYSSQNQHEQLDELTEEVLTLFSEEADSLHSQLKDFPFRDQIKLYQVMNDVATVLFIRAESYMKQGKTSQAIKLFGNLKTRFKHAQAWDPSRGSYWSIAEKSQASIDVMLGKESMKKAIKERPKTVPSIYASGTETIVDYTKYGEFKNVGTENYKYVVTDREGLSKAVGEGIFPNTLDVFKNPRYGEVVKQGRLEGSHWDFVNITDLEAAYFKWVAAPEPWGVRLFYIASIFEKAKMYERAVKAYRALVVMFPDTVAWTYWQTPWYPGQVAVSKIKHILRERPELRLRYKLANIYVENSLDNDTSNDVITTYPGVLEKADNGWERPKKVTDGWAKESLGKVKRKLGEGRVRLVQYENDHWQLLVDDKPFIIKGLMYAPTKVGQSPDQGTLANWMKEDTNDNGKPDGPYDSWIDKNNNNQQDKNEPIVGDFRLMKEMGTNVIRLYHDPDEPVREVLRDLYKRYGIMVIMGDFLGKYTIGSGATWFEGTDYENEEHKKNMMNSVRKMVEQYKDEEFILMWALGNENNYGVACNADKKPEAYFKFANEVAKMMKEIDPDHPVSIVNGDTLFLDIFGKHAPDIDVYSANVYRGDYGFGSFWDQVKDAADKPAFIKEFGAPSYGHHMTLEEAEEAQAAYHRGNWYDILENSAGYKYGVGNSIGGVIFEWMDEWWKNYEPALHDTETDVIGPFPGGYYFEEWFGIVGQGRGKHSPFLRKPRKAYYTYKQLWNE